MRHIFYLLIIGLFSLAACNETVVLDTELLDEDQANVQFKTDFELTANTLVEDSILVYSPNTDYTNYPFGTMLDPVFGKVSSSITGQLRLVSPQSNPNESGGIFDSVVLSLAYSTDGSYGNTNEMYELEVLRLTEDVDREASYYSDQVFGTEAMNVGTASFIPNPVDSVFINIYEEGADIDSLYKRAAHKRIPLDFTFGKELFELDSTHYENVIDSTGVILSVANEVFLEAFKGLHIRPTSENGGLLGFDLRSADTRLTLYSHTSSGPEEFNIFFTEVSAKTLHFENDYTNAPIEAFIDNQPMGDSLVFTQGMTGPFIELDFPNLSAELNNVIINKAELELYIANIDAPSDNFEATEQLILLEQVDTARVLIEDAVVAIAINSLEDFGGTVRTDADGVQKYTMNISAHLQEMLNGTAGSKLFVQPFPKAADFSRTVFYGANHSTYPIRLKVTYTQLD